MPQPSSQRPPGQDWLQRRIRELERRVRELWAGRRLESATIGAGGVTVQGGEIVITDEAGEEDLARFSSDGIFFSGTPLVLPGAVTMFAGPDVPDGWLLCDGSAVSRDDHQLLFNAIGTTWGTGDGSTTFNVPDLTGGFLRGGSSGQVGNSGGSTSHNHTNPSTGSAGGHSHSVGSTGSAGSHSHGTGGPSQTVNRVVDGDIVDATASQSHTHSTGSNGSHSHSVPSTGGDGGHDHSVGSTGSENHMPPHARLLPIIRT